VDNPNAKAGSSTLAEATVVGVNVTGLAANCNCLSVSDDNFPDNGGGTVLAD